MQKLKAENLVNRSNIPFNLRLTRGLFGTCIEIFCLQLFIYSLWSINLLQTSSPYRTFVFIVTPIAGSIIFQFHILVFSSSFTSLHGLNFHSLPRRIPFSDTAANIVKGHRIPRAILENNDGFSRGFIFFLFFFFISKKIFEDRRDAL